MRRGSRRVGQPQVLFGAPIAVLLTVFFALPLGMVLVLSVRPFDAQNLVGTGWTLENFGKFLFDAHFYADLWRTFAISLSTTLLCVCFGYPLAWHLHTLRSKSARLWLTLIVLLPLMTSFVVSSFAWLLLLGNNGLINRFLLSIGVVAQAIPLLNTVAGVVIVNTYSYVPFAILAIFSALQNIDPAFSRAARIHGGSDVQVFLRVVLPLSVPGIVAGGLIVFALSMAGFVVPFLIGGGRVMVVPLMIFRYTLQLFDWPDAAALGVLLFVVTLGLTWLLSVLAQRHMAWER